MQREEKGGRKGERKNRKLRKVKRGMAGEKIRYEKKAYRVVDDKGYGKIVNAKNLSKINWIKFICIYRLHTGRQAVCMINIILKYINAYINRYINQLTSP
jgi:hypothetical protein